MSAYLCFQTEIMETEKTEKTEKTETEKETYARKKQRQLKRLRRELDIACPPGGFDTGHAVWQDYMHVVLEKL